MKILTFGVFDYFHLGHLRLFKQCKEHADYLIVAVQSGEYIRDYKPEAQILYSTEERVEILESLRMVDSVIVYNTVGVEALQMIEEKEGFDILALGEDHIGKRFDDICEWCTEHNKKIVRLKRTQGISSSSIKEELKKQ